MKSALLLAIIFVLFGCAPVWSSATVKTFEPAHTFNVCFMSDFGDQTPDITNAINMWDRSLHEWAAINVSDHNCQIELNIVEPQDSEAKNALAYCDMLGGMQINFVRGRFENNSQDIALHEMGHIFGAQHVPGTLMDARYRHVNAVCPDSTTVAQIAAYHHINLEMLSWCSP